jgi:hypothetical protein
MPSEEIATIVRADDPQLVHRYLELHMEGLVERLADERRTLDHLERLLTAGGLRNSRATCQLEPKTQTARTASPGGTTTA